MSPSQTSTASADTGLIRITSVGHALLAAVMIWLGVMGLMTGQVQQVWQPLPKWIPAPQAVAYACALLSLGSGVGLLVTRTAAASARVLVAVLIAWLVVLRLPYLFIQKPLVLVAWTCGMTSVMAGAAWVLYIRLAGAHDQPRLGGLAGETGLRIARVLYGLALVPFGLAHFLYLDATTVLIPAWLPWHTAWAYFTGAAFIAAGLGVATGVLGRLAATLSTLQMGLFLVIIWIPRVLAGTVSAFQWGEFVANCALLAAGWVVAESWGGGRISPTAHAT